MICASVRVSFFANLIRIGRHAPPKTAPLLHALMFLALWLAASSATAALPAPTGLQAEIKIGSLTLNLPSVAQRRRLPGLPLPVPPDRCQHPHL